MNKPTRVCLTCLYLVSMASMLCHAQDKDIASLIQQFDHPYVRVQHSAAWNAAHDAQLSLVEIGEPAVPALIMALNHKNPAVRQRTVRVLYTMRFNNENIVRAMLKALKDDDAKVRSTAIDCLVYFSDGFSGELASEIISGLVQLLYYGSPFFSGFDVGRRWHNMAIPVRAALTHALHRDALHSSEWSLRFGAAITYGNAFRMRHRGNRKETPPPEAKIATVSTLAKGLTHPDWKVREDAIYVLRRLDDDFDGARQALEGLPPFGIISQTIRDGEEVRDSDALDSLNADGITFKFNRSIYSEQETITIKPVDGEPLGWNIEKSSHSVTITPQKGQGLVKGQDYTIQLKDFMDVAWNQVDAEIEFSTKVPLSSTRHAH